MSECGFIGSLLSVAAELWDVKTPQKHPQVYIALYPADSVMMLNGVTVLLLLTKTIKHVLGN